MRSSPILVVALAAALAQARTDIAGCVSTATKNQYNEASLLWYVPGTGEICDFLDCGGGRAPPKTTVPGCPLYKGTATYSPDYLPGFNGASSTQGPPASTAVAVTTAAVSAHASASSSKETGVITTAPATTPAPVSGSSTLVTSAAGSAQSSGAPAPASNGTAVVVPSGGNNSTGSKPTTGTPSNPSSTPNAAAGALVPGAMGAIAAAFALFL